MSFVDLDAHCLSIVDNETRECVDIRVAVSRYPTLKGYRYSNQVLLISSDLNVYCTDVEIQHNGDEYVALPYLMDAKVRLYSRPVVFSIGFDNPNGFGIVPYQNWQERFYKYLIDKDIVRKVQLFLDSHAPVNYL